MMCSLLEIFQFGKPSDDADSLPGRDVCREHGPMLYFGMHDPCFLQVVLVS